MELLKNSEVMIYLAVVFALFLFIMFFKLKDKLVFKVVFRFLMGAALIVMFNYVAAKMIHITIPFNPLNAAILGFLEIPGLALIFIVKYIVYPM